MRTSTKNATKFFVVSYTNKVKNYCEVEFFKRFNEIALGHLSLVVDNTPGRDYFEHIVHLTPYVAHIDVDREPVGSLFQRNVALSAEFCRQKFLESGADVMVIIESDVIPPGSLLSELDKTITHLGHSEGNRPWGIIGGLYYPGFHDFSLDGLHETQHVLSGCTAYRRSLLEEHPFRYDPNNLAAFSDAFMSMDAGAKYTLWNDHSIICRHLAMPNGARQTSLL